MMPKIYGFNKSSEAGPDNFCPSIFLASCNLKCDYCMNARLVNNHNLKEIPIREIEKFVAINKSEWINISGGEITTHKAQDLEDLLKKIKSWGCKISISTNGILTNKLLNILQYIDYVSMDIKTGCNKYNFLLKSICSQFIFYNVRDSLHIMKIYKKNDGYFDYDIRTTLYPPLVGKEEINEIGSILNGQDKWILQPFRKTKIMLGEKASQVEPYTKTEIDVLVKIAKKYSNNISIGYV